MKRYNYTLSENAQEFIMVPDQDGQWVQYSEIKKLAEDAARWNKYKELFAKMSDVTEAMAPVLHFRLLMEDAKNGRL